MFEMLASAVPRLAGWSAASLLGVAGWACFAGQQPAAASQAAAFPRPAARAVRSLAANPRGLASLVEAVLAGQRPLAARRRVRITTAIGIPAHAPVPQAEALAPMLGQALGDAIDVSPCGSILLTAAARPGELDMVIGAEPPAGAHRVLRERWRRTECLIESLGGTASVETGTGVAILRLRLPCPSRGRLGLPCPAQASGAATGDSPIGLASAAEPEPAAIPNVPTSPPFDNPWWRLVP